jgi:hypothetical protein
MPRPPPPRIGGSNRLPVRQLQMCIVVEQVLEAFRHHIENPFARPGIVLNGDHLAFHKTEQGRDQVLRQVSLEGKHHLLAF